MAGNAAIYIVDLSMMRSKVFDKIPDVLKYTDLSKGNQAVGLQFTLKNQTIAMTLCPQTK